MSRVTHELTTLALVLALALAGCAVGAKSSHDGHGEVNAGELASCTGGNVPLGASNCLLDLQTGKDTYWVDTDGVDPGTAGCHDEYVDSTCGEVKPGREFGEFCLDDDRLVESNPGRGVCHTHGGDLGKPDVISCSAWCAENGGTAGRCEGGVVAQSASGTCESARCVCG